MSSLPVCSGATLSAFSIVTSDVKFLTLSNEWVLGLRGGTGRAEFKFDSLQVEFKISPPGVSSVSVVFTGAYSSVPTREGGGIVVEEEGREGDLGRAVEGGQLSRCFLEK